MIGHKKEWSRVKKPDTFVSGFFYLAMLEK